MPRTKNKRLFLTWGLLSVLSVLHTLHLHDFLSLLLLTLTYVCVTPLSFWLNRHDDLLCSLIVQYATNLTRRWKVKPDYCLGWHADHLLRRPVAADFFDFSSRIIDNHEYQMFTSSMLSINHLSIDRPTTHNTSNSMSYYSAASTTTIKLETQTPHFKKQELAYWLTY